eukprot:gene38478-47515_t
MPLPAAQQQRRTCHSVAAVRELDQAWALLARLQLAANPLQFGAACGSADPEPVLAALLDEADRIVSNLDYHLAQRRVAKADAPEPGPVRPSTAQCRCVLADGRVLTVTASRRPRANRAEVKCAVPGAPALSERVQEVVRLARHTESRFDSRDQVVLSMDIAPAGEERGWELAAVLADRMVRGAWQPIVPQVYAYGWSDNWHRGSVAGQPDLAAA